jgi:tRNA 2-selenouridine synthase
MPEKRTISEFLTERTTAPLIDVRSPGEFVQGHIPGALSIPLFSDEERAIVGTLYKQQGRDEAVLKGLDIVGPKMSSFVLEARKIAPDRKLRVHCWRGGMRSESMAWLWSMNGFEVSVLTGGYKAYRQQVHSDFAAPLKLKIVGGKTGSGKTEVIRILAEKGEQVLDLEGIAHHKGSAFGALGQAPQPTVEQFENDLHLALSQLDRSKTIWVEDESVSIGRVFIPQPFWEQMMVAPVYVAEVPFELRVERLVAEYGCFSPEELENSLLKIEKRLGGNNLKPALAALHSGDYAEVARISLRYYDKAYALSFARKAQEHVHLLPDPGSTPREIAEKLIRFIPPNER